MKLKQLLSLILIAVIASQLVGCYNRDSKYYRGVGGLRVKPTHQQK